MSPSPKPTSSTESAAPGGRPRATRRRKATVGGRASVTVLTTAKIREAAAQRLGVERRIVHPLRLGAAAGPVHRQTRLKRKVSATRPGPNAIAMPGPLALLRQQARQHERQRGGGDVADVAQHGAGMGEGGAVELQRLLDRVQHGAAAGMDRPVRWRFALQDAAGIVARALRAQGGGDDGRHLSGQVHVEPAVADAPGDQVLRARAGSRRGNARAPTP